LFERLSSST